MVERERDEHAGSGGSPSARSRDTDVEFDAVVQSLRADPSWRWRLRMIRLRHAIVSAAAWSLRYLAELGCWFTGVPPQRCARSGAAAPGAV